MGVGEEEPIKKKKKKKKSLIFSHQTQKKISFWPKMLQWGAAYWCSGCHLLIAKGFRDPIGC